MAWPLQMPSQPHPTLELGHCRVTALASIGACLEVLSQNGVLDKEPHPDLRERVGDLRSPS